jgi:hypothetical protein
MVGANGKQIPAWGFRRRTVCFSGQNFEFDFLLAVVATPLLAMEKAGIIRRSNSPWASPLHLVCKKDGSWRPCGDYRRLNTVIIPDRYPLPNMQSVNDRMAGCTVFFEN